LVFFLYGNEVGDLAVYHIFESVSPAEFSVLRSDATNSFGGKFHRYQLFLTTLPNLLLVVAYLKMKESKNWVFLFILIFTSTVFYSLLNVEKGPVIRIFLLIFWVHMFIYPEMRIKKIVFLFSGIFTVLIFMYIIFMGMKDYQIIDILGAILHRIFIGQVHPLYWWQLYLEEHGSLGFSGMPNPGGIFPFHPVSSTVIIHQFAFPEVASKGIVGSMPTVFFAYWMLNFGYITAFFSMFFFGFILQFVEFLFSKVLRSSPSVFVISYYIVMIDFFLKFVADDYAGIFFDLNWILPLVICFFYYFIVVPKNKVYSV
jgi:oligosaccharide repeat unit polymerase